MDQSDAALPGLSPEALERAESALAALEGRWRRTARADSRRLRAELETLRCGTAPQETARLFAIAHDMKGQAATFGVPAITELANRLCRRIEATRRPVGEDFSEWDQLVSGIEAALAALPADEA